MDFRNFEIRSDIILCKVNIRILLFTIYNTICTSSLFCPLMFLTTLQYRQTTSKLKLPWTLLRIKTASACCYQHQLFSMKKNERLQRDRMGAARYFRVHNRASNEPSRRLCKVLQGLQCQSHKGRVIRQL